MKKKVEDPLWKNIIGFLVWLGTILVLILGVIVGVITYEWIDNWEGNIEGSILSFTVSVIVFGAFLSLFSYLYGRYVIVPEMKWRLKNV